MKKSFAVVLVATTFITLAPLAHAHAARPISTDILQAVAKIAAAELHPQQTLAELDDLIALDPDNPKGYLDRAQALRDQPRPQWDYQKIQSDYDKAIELSQARLGKISGYDATAQAARELEKADLDAAFIGRGELLLQQGKRNDAFLAFNKASSLGIYGLRVIAGRARIFILQGDPAIAIEKISTALPEARAKATRPGDLKDGFFARGLAFIALKQWPEALSDFDAALYSDSQDEASRNPDYYFYRGLAQQGLGQNDKALDDFNVAVKLDSQLAAKLPELRGKLAPREPDKRALQSINIDTPVAHKLMGNEWRLNNEMEKAREEYSKAIALDANYADAYNNRGASYRESKLFDQALQDYNKAIALKPDTRFLANRGWLYLETKKYSEGLADFQRAAALAPQDGGVAADLANALRVNDKFAEAEVAFETALKLATGAEVKTIQSYEIIYMRALQNKTVTEAETKLFIAMPDSVLKNYEKQMALYLQKMPDNAALAALHKAAQTEAERPVGIV